MVDGSFLNLGQFSDNLGRSITSEGHLMSDALSNVSKNVNLFGDVNNLSSDDLDLLVDLNSLNIGHGLSLDDKTADDLDKSLDLSDLSGDLLGDLSNNGLLNLDDSSLLVVNLRLSDVIHCSGDFLNLVSKVNHLLLEDGDLSFDDCFLVSSGSQESAIKFGNLSLDDSSLVGQVCHSNP